LHQVQPPQQIQHLLDGARLVVNGNNDGKLVEFYQSRRGANKKKKAQAGGPPPTQRSKLESRPHKPSFGYFAT
jgi:hypothetical protein